MQTSVILEFEHKRAQNEHSEWMFQMKVSHKCKWYIWFIQQDKNVKLL